MCACVSECVCMCEYQIELEKLIQHLCDSWTKEAVGLIAKVIHVCF